MRTSGRKVNSGHLRRLEGSCRLMAGTWRQCGYCRLLLPYACLSGTARPARLGGNPDWNSVFRPSSQLNVLFPELSLAASAREIA